MKRLSESVWGNIRKKSLGQEVRKEDDIEHLDRDGLYDYIFSIYELVNEYPKALKSETTPENKYISLPLFKINKLYKLGISFHNGVIYEINLQAGQAEIKEFKDELIKNFDAELKDNGSFKITSKDGKVSNQICMDFIQFVIENSSNPLLKKRENI